MTSRPLRDVQRLAGRRGPRGGHAVRWDDIETLMAEIATRSNASGGAYATAIGNSTGDTLTLDPAHYAAITYVDNEVQSARDDLNAAIASIEQSTVSERTINFLDGASMTTSLTVGLAPAANIPDTDIEDDATSGPVLQSTGFRVVAFRRAFQIEIGHTYEVEARVRITVDSLQTGGTREASGVDFILMNADGTLFPTPALTVPPDAIRVKDPHRVADGWVVLRGRFTAPVGAQFFRPRVYSQFDSSATKGDATWQVQYLTLTDVTDGVTIKATIDTDIAALVSEDTALAGRIDTVEAAVDQNAAAITSEQIARVNADNALASDITTLTSEFNGLESSVTTQAATLATLESYNAATYAIRLTAGGATNEVEFVAADDPINGPTSSVRFTASTVLFEGSVTTPLLAAKSVTADVLAAGAATASKLLITGDATNLIQDPYFSDADLWEATDVEIVPVSNTLWNTPRVLWLRGSANAFTIKNSRHFAVSPAHKLATGYQGVTFPGDTGVTFCQLQFCSDGSFTQATTTGFAGMGGSITGNTIQTRSAKDIAVPAGSRFARVQFVKGNSNVSGAYLASAFVRLMTDGELIVEGALAVQGMSAFGGALQSTNYSPNSAGWRIETAGNAQFNGIVLSRQLQVDSGSIPYPQTLFQPDDFFSVRQTIYVEATNVSISAWTGAQAAYVAEAGYVGGVNTSNTSQCYWGVRATVLPLTKFSGNQTLRLKLDIWARNVNRFDAGTINWRIYKVT